MPFLGGRGQASRGYFGGGTTPGAPTVGTATPGDGQISLAFTAPTFDGGLTITTYQYALSTDSYATWTTRSTGTTGSPIVITGLTNGTSYSVKIRAVNSLGAGEASGASTATSPFGAPIVVTSPGSDATTTPTAPTTSSPTALQTFSTTKPRVTRSVAGSETWTNPYPSGASTGTGTLNGSSGTTHFVWGTSSGSYPNEVAATSNAYVRTTWPRGTAVYYKAKIINTSCIATFNGTVNANGASTTVTFEYGTSSGVYPSSVSAGTVTALTATAVTANVSLAANTYYFRTKGVNAQGTPQYGIERSVTISAKSATAASEQSFTPPAVTAIQNILVVGGGSGRGYYDLQGGGGGGVTHKASAAVGDTVSITTGGGSTGNVVGGTSQLICAGATMTAYGGGTYVDNPYPTADRAASSGSASGGDTNYASSQGGVSYYFFNENTSSGGGGGGAGGAGTGEVLCDPTPTNPYDGGAYVDVGGAGGSHVNIFGFLVGGGGGGASDYGTENTGVCGDLQGADGGGTYGKGARAYITGTRGGGSGDPNYYFAYPPSSQTGTDGIVTFEWVGPA